MIKLRLVGHTADLQQLIYTSRKRGRKGSHVVAIDDRLFDELRDVVKRRNRKQKAEAVAAARAAAPQATPKLAPREVQRLLRAGRPAATVARLAEAPVSWVERFLGPVLYERAGVVQECQKAVLEKPRLGNSGLPLGESVLSNLRTRRVATTEDDFAEGWDASRLDSHPWTVTLRFRYRGREQRAMWKYDPTTRTVTAGNRLGADLGWVPEGRKPVSPVRGGVRRAKVARRAPAKRRPVARRKPPRRGAPTRRKPARRATAGRKPAARRARRR